MSRYMLVLVISGIVPLLASFYPPLKFYKNSRALLLSIAIILIAFGLWTGERRAGGRPRAAARRRQRRRLRTGRGDAPLREVLPGRRRAHAHRQGHRAGPLHRRPLHAARAGWVAAESPGPGRGATFSVAWPKPGQEEEHGDPARSSSATTRSTWPRHRREPGSRGLRGDHGQRRGGRPLAVVSGGPISSCSTS